MKKPLYKQKSFWTALTILAALFAPNLIPMMTPEMSIKLAAGLGALEAVFVTEKFYK